MGDRRLIFYSDARHTHVYAYDPPIRVEDVVAPIDDVAGTGVDTFVFGFGTGHTVFHNTRVGETWGEHVFKDGNNRYRDPDIWSTLASWRAYENMKSLRERGLDIMELQIARAHELGLDYFGSIRTNHSQDPANTSSADNSSFKIQHPELHLKSRRGHPLNWVYPEVRAERFALIEEAVTEYDLDGMELDFVFRPHLFEVGEVDGNAHIVTQFMRDVRRLMDGAGSERGRSLALGARVLPTPASNAAAGFDIATWIREGIVDFVVPAVYGPRQMDADFPFEWLVNLAEATDCSVYPALFDKVYSVRTSGVTQENRHIREHSASVEHYRATAASYWAKGADALYLPWFEWPVGAAQRQILSEIRDPAVIREKPKQYCTGLRDVDGDYGYSSQLPMTLQTGVDTSEQVIDLHLADTSPRARSRLRLKLTGSVAADRMSVRFNGTALDWTKARITRHGGGGDIYALAEMPLADGLIEQRQNQLGVAVDSRPESLIANVILESVEVLVDYPGHQAVPEFDRISMRPARVHG